MRASILMSITGVMAIVLCVNSTPLDDYVNKPDPSYSYRFLVKYKAPGVTVHVLNMTSQTWLSKEVLDRPVWWHYLCIIIPDKFDYKDSAFLWIDQGGNDDKVPTLADDFLALISTLAATTNSVSATIKQIPNQPIVFKDDPEQKRRSEDAIIAWTWMKFIRNGSNPEILLRLPMTKAVVRGMDTITTYVKNVTGNTVDKFVVGGASKRGWTTWTTAAVDKRVIAMIPVVMDLLNTRKNLHHHYRSLGGWTFAFDSYYEVNITRDLDSPNMQKMQAVIDPLTYNDRYTMPKMVVSAGGDEFFLPDDSHYYYNQLTGPKYLRIVPNAEHAQVGHIMSDILAMRSFYINVLEKATMPTVTWQRNQTATGGKITVKTSKPPSLVLVYHSHTTDAKRRDFRLLIKNPTGSGSYPHPVIWFRATPKKISDTEYEAEIAKPESGWAAFFLSITFDGVKDTEIDITTEACIVPDVFPFPDCSGDGCHGSLV